MLRRAVLIACTALMALAASACQSLPRQAQPSVSGSPSSGPPPAPATSPESSLQSQDEPRPTALQRIGPTTGDYEYSVDWFSSRIDQWTEMLAPYTGRDGLQYLEIGIYEARSAVWILQNVLTGEGSHLTAVDPFFSDDLENQCLRNLVRSGSGDRATVIRGFSQIELRELPLESFDVIYIDGSHTADDVLADAVLSWGLLREGGLLIFDDYEWTGHFPGEGEGRMLPVPTELKPKVAIDAFLTSYRYFLDVVHRDYQLAVRKKANPSPDKLHGSPIGQYVYDWRKKALLDADAKPVQISSDERVFIEGLLHLRRFGETEFVVGAGLRNQKTFQDMVKRLELDLDTTVAGGGRP